MPSGVYKHKIKHGLYKSKFWNIYRAILTRTKYNNGSFPRYINKKCYWNNFIDFKNDMYAGYIQHCKKYGEKLTSIDRINNEGDYCKENCRWATPKEQANNRRNNIILTFEGTTLTAQQWSEKLGLPAKRIRKRKKNGWSDYETLICQPRDIRHR